MVWSWGVVCPVCGMPLYYEEKVHTFLTDNNIHSLPGDPTKKHQTLVSKALQQCNLILHKKQIRHWTQPPLKAQLKLHKPDIPIRPTVNNRSAPAYKTARKLNSILKQHLHLNSYYTINNSTELAQNLTRLTINDNHRLISLKSKAAARKPDTQPPSPHHTDNLKIKH
jgi:hypothetical protein